ncbi:MAG: phosphate transporter, permease protein PstA [Pseudomonadota bacterium]|jgi:phosphate transport system permease protein
MKQNLQQWVASGNPWIWLTAGAVSLSLVMVFGLLVLIAANGLEHFWPKQVAALTVQAGEAEPEILLGEIVDEETVSATRVREAGGTVPEGMVVVRRLLVKVGNRDVGGSDFRWIPETEIRNVDYPSAALVAERTEWGNFYGYLVAVREGEDTLPATDPWQEIPPRLARVEDMRGELRQLERVEMGHINAALEDLRLRERSLRAQGDEAGALALAPQRESLDARFKELSTRIAELHASFDRDSLLVRTAAGEERVVPLGKVVRIFQPNDMHWGEKAWHYLMKVGEFVGDEPREANTEGGVFPAIFGTVLMVMVMSVIATPFGVVAAVYLREYAKPGPVTSAIRIAVNNLAGVPSIVYGVFGFGFFVYFLGGNIDRLFFAEKLPAPTFGTPGLLWSALTLALLTVPVVIVATEEGLTRIPRAIREGSLALGATKAETLWRTVLPMATPAMMTGLILAVARAAGEVAPLMMVGVVKLAPTLPLDGEFPFLHLDRKFMHLGFHIYDVGFQSPNVEAARPLVFATALLLVLIIVSLNLAAIQIRNRLREKYHAADN